MYILFSREKNSLQKEKKMQNLNKPAKTGFIWNQGGGGNRKIFFPQNSKLEFSLYVSLKNVVKLKS